MTDVARYIVVVGMRTPEGWALWHRYEYSLPRNTTPEAAAEKALGWLAGNANMPVDLEVWRESPHDLWRRYEWTVGREPLPQTTYRYFLVRK